MLLRVRIVEAKDSENPNAKIEMCAKRRETLGRTIHVVGRSYQKFVVRDAGKRGKEAIWFLAVDGPAHDHEALSRQRRRFLSVEDALASLADFRRCPSVPKFAARVELALSGTTETLSGLRFVPCRQLKSDEDLVREWDPFLNALESRVPPAAEGTVNVVEVPDIYGIQEGGSPGLDPTGARYLMTDGSGLISCDLARMVHQASEDSFEQKSPLPLVFQKRLWYQGSLTKGVLMVSALLPRRTIVVRKSQIKVEGASTATRANATPSEATLSGGCNLGRASLEVVRAQLEPYEASFSHFLVPLLQAAGGEPMVDVMLELQKEAATDPANTFRIVSSHKPLTEEQAVDIARTYCDAFEVDYGVTPFDMLMAGMDTRDDYLRERIVKLLKEKLRSVGSRRIT